MNPVRNVERKLDRCVRLLEELNSQMRDLRRLNSEQQKLCVETIRMTAAEVLAQAGMPETVAAERSETTPATAPVKIAEKTQTEETPAVVKQEKTPEFPEIMESAVKRGFNVDKHGRVYTEEEIESIISD